MVVVFLAFIFGRLVGGMLNRNMVVKKHSGKIHYNRHPIIFGVWIFAVVVRIFVEFFYNVETATFIMTAILAISTGMLVSESRLLHIKTRHKKRQDG